MNENTNMAQNEVVMEHVQVGRDLKNAVLIVSVVVNMAIFTTWLTLQFA
jgi:hypothetical protein